MQCAGRRGAQRQRKVEALFPGVQGRPDFLLRSATQWLMQYVGRQSARSASVSAIARDGPSSALHRWKKAPVNAAHTGGCDRLSGPLASAFSRERPTPYPLHGDSVDSATRSTASIALQRSLPTSLAASLARQHALDHRQNEAQIKIGHVLSQHRRASASHAYRNTRVAKKLPL